MSTKSADGQSHQTPVHSIAKKAEVTQEVLDDALSLFNQAEEEGFIQQRARDEVAAAAVYLGAKREGHPVFPREIAEAAGIERPELLRMRRALDCELGLDVPPSDPVSYIQRFCDELDLESEYTGNAVQVFEAYKQQNGISGSPSSLAAGAIYAAAVEYGFDVTQSELSTLADVSEVTVRSRYTEQLDAFKSN